MSEKIIVSRDKLELGALTKVEAQELLHAGFLKPTDVWRSEDSTKQFPLRELLPSPAAPAFSKVLKQKLTGAGQSLVDGATQVASKLKSAAGRGHGQLTLSSRQMLEAFVPQLQKLVSHQLLSQPVESIRGALGNEKFMRTFFGAIYDCLPKPVCRFVAEDAFVAFCMERREQLFKNASPSGSIMKTIAIIGASNDRNKFGNKAVRAFRQQGYEVFPVNPKDETIEGLCAFKSITDVPVRPQMISVYLPPPVLVKVLPDIAARGCDELWLNPGTESAEVLAEAERLKLNVIQACSIVGVGVSPATL